MALSLVIGLGIPFLAYGLFTSAEIYNFFSLLLIGTLLTFIFVALIALLFEDKIKGFGFSIISWLFFAVIYDGLFLILILMFDDYPLDKFALFASIFAPIDLSRILIILKLDIAALLGYTGAVFQDFFGTDFGMLFYIFLLFLWILIPILLIVYISKNFY